MAFRRGQIVEIIRIDKGDDPAWVGFQAEVADVFTAGATASIVENIQHTRLVPLSDRPDSHYPEVDPRAWFYWPTEDLALVKDVEEYSVQIGEKEQ